MESDDGFEAFGDEIKSDPLGVLLAKWRRDAFITRLERLPDVKEVIPSGSLARGTQIGRVRDIDLIVVFDKSAHPDYGSGPESAQAAMTYLQGKLLEQLHPLSDDLMQEGAREGLVKETELKETKQRTHVVTCRGGWTGPFAEFIPSAPPVDVMPAVREGSHLLVPERDPQGKSKWVDVDPETLMRQVAQRQREWEYFTEVVGMVKAWAKQENLGMKNLAVEVIVLKYCPRPRMFETLSCGEAVRRFFDAANKAHITSLEDPAGRCGKIDPHFNSEKLRRKLNGAAGLARQAMDAEYAWKERLQTGEAVTHPDVFWHRLFGKKYPKAKERFWRPRVTEPWFGKYRVEPVAAFGSDGLGSDRPGGRKPPKGGPKPPPNGGGPKPPRNDGPEERDDLRPETPFRDLGEPGLRPPWRGDRPAPRPGGDFGWSGDTHGGSTERGSPGAAASPGSAGTSPGRHAGPTSAGPGTNLWTGVFGPAAATVSVPLTFG
jgi:hypothetical protein